MNAGIGYFPMIGYPENNDVNQNDVGPVTNNITWIGIIVSVLLVILICCICFGIYGIVGAGCYIFGKSKSRNDRFDAFKDNDRGSSIL